MENRRFYVGLVVIGLGIALVIALLSPLASSDPDGLERVAEDEEFLDEAKEPPYEVISDYLFPGVENENVATVLAGISGVLIVALLAFGIGFVLRKTSKKTPARPTSRPGGQT